MRHAVVACLVTLFAAAGADAATRTWEGDVDTNWNTPGNWAENLVPANGDDLVFPDNPTSRDSNNNIAGLSINSIAVTTTNTGAAYNFTGTGITLAGPMGFTNNGSGGTSNPHWQIPLTLGAAVTLTTSGRLTFIEGDVALGANTLTLALSGDVFIDGMVAGAGGLTKSGGSALTLAGTNTYSGATQVNGGTVTTFGPSALGTSAAGTTFANGTTLNLSVGSYALPEPLTFSGPIGTVNMIANVQLTGALAFTGTLTFNMLTNGSLAGVITSAGTLVVAGNDSLSMSGDSPAFTGAIDITTGSFIPTGSFAAAINLQGPGTLFGHATAGPLTMTGGTLAPGIAFNQFFAFTGLASSGGMHNLVMAPGAPVTNYDQLQVTGTVSLGGTTLNTTAAAVQALGSTFVIILNDGVDPVVGTYVDKPEGTIYLQANNWWQITYAGGDGNDVVLTTVAEPLQAAVVPVPGPGPLALALLGLAILAASRRRR